MPWSIAWSMDSLIIIFMDILIVVFIGLLYILAGLGFIYLIVYILHKKGYILNKNDKQN